MEKRIMAKICDAEKKNAFEAFVRYYVHKLIQLPETALSAT